MTASAADELFFTRAGLNRDAVAKIVGAALQGADDGELYLEYRQSESVALDDGKIKSASFDTTQGFGLRAVAGEATGFAHSVELSEEAIERAAVAVKAVTSNHSGTMADAPPRTNRLLYTDRIRSP
jgi:TldD protein